MRGMMRSLSMLFAVPLLLAGFVTLAQELSGIPDEPAGFTIRGDLDAGRSAYLEKCASCHGENGDGNGKIKLKPPARDLRDRDRMDRRSDWEIFVVIRDGGKKYGMSPQMIPWGSMLSEQELQDLTAFVRSLSAAGETGDPASGS